RSHYQQAQKAATLHRWEDALAQYSAARGYKDADARAAEAAGKIRERDHQYAIATRLKSAGSPSSPIESAHTLQAARAVQSIQPNYKNIKEIAAEAEEQVYDGALGGAIVSRKQAGRPGLYYRVTHGWIWLKGSDAWSKVLATSCGDRVIYDVPASGWTTPAPAPSPLYD